MRIPLLASPQGGGGRAINKKSRSLLNREAGVVFRLKTKGKPPRLRPLRRLRAILSVGAATPPCGDARRGILHYEPFGHFFTALMSARDAFLGFPVRGLKDAVW